MPEVSKIVSAEKERSFDLDLIRSIAAISVVAGHFFVLNTPFNETPFVGVSMFLQGTLRSIFTNLGVPLFLMLTGYLNYQKTYSLTYYKAIIRILIAYVIISVITYFSLDSDFSILSLLKGLLSWKIISYSWYLEMYVGLFLIIPFLNIIIHSIKEDRRAIFGLGAILLFSISLPSFFNRGTFQLLPDYWTFCYPILFYFIGACIRIYKPRLHKWLAICIVLFICLLNPVVNSITPPHGGMIAYVGTYYGIVGMWVPILIFIISLDSKTALRPAKKIVTMTSELSLNIFLFSYLFDKLLYPIFINNHFVSQSQFVMWFIPCVVSVFVCSFIAAWMLDWALKRTSIKFS